jgi:flagellar hook-associated protein 2
MSSSSSSTSSSSIGNLQTSSLLRLTGTNLMSGLDTDSIIKALVSGTQSKIDKQKQLEQIAEWKRTMYQDVTTSLKSLSTTYFSYTNSSTNLLSSTFFDSSTLTSSSSAVTATGRVSAAKAIKIENISQLATAASYTSAQVASDEAITSGKIEPSWQKSNVGGQSVTVTYGGKDYTLSLSASVAVDSNDVDANGNLADAEIQKVVSGLNDQISSNSNLKGKVKFTDTNGEITLAAVNSSGQEDGTQTVALKANSQDTTDSTAFLQALGFSTSTTGSGHVTGSAVQVPVSSSAFFSHTISGSSQFTLNYGGESYTVKLGSDIDTTDLSASDVASKIASQLNSQISSSSALTDLTGKVSFSVSGTDSTPTITLTNEGSESLSITGASEDLQNGLDFALNSSIAANGGSLTSQSFSTTQLTTTYLGDALAGSTLTVKLNGLQKSITFDASQESDYDTASELETYLQSAVDSNFGSGKISVDYDSTSGKLSFRASDTTSVLSLSSSDNINVLSQNGALRIESGDTNRINVGDTLSDLVSSGGGTGKFSQTLLAGSDGTYKITINGETLSFSGSDTVGDIMTKINDDSAAGVTVSYSQTTDTFRIVSSDTGSQGKVNISDASGNLAATLFGISSDKTTAATGAISTDGSGNVTNSSTSSYQITLGTNSAQTISLGTSYDSVSDLVTAVQSALSSNSTLNGKVDVSYDTTSKTISFKAHDGTSALSVQSTGSGNILNTQSTAGQDLVMSADLNGSSTPTTITRSSNSFTLDGVTITANRETNSTDTLPITFSSGSSTDDLYKKIQDFVTAYNTIIAKVNTYTTDMPQTDTDTGAKYAPLTETQKADMTSDEITAWNTKAQQGLLENDNTLNGILSNFNNVINSLESSSGLSLSQIGIGTAAGDYTSGGQLTITETTLKSALSTEPDKVEELFTNATDGIAQQITQVLDKYVGTSGGTGELISIAGTSTSTTNDSSDMGVQINAYETNITKLKTQLSTEEDRWWTKFTNMETSLSKLNSQMTYLDSMTSSSSSSSS